VGLHSVLLPPSPDRIPAELLTVSAPPARDLNRQLYVAITRAQRELYLCGGLPPLYASPEGTRAETPKPELVVEELDDGGDVAF
jgi:superfamily I DNA/RNA helicase